MRVGSAGLALLVVLMCGGTAFAQRGDRNPIDQSKPDDDWAIPAAPVRTPEETIESFELPPGFRAELVAAEPLLHDPVAIDFGQDGRLWVVELPSYNWPYRESLPGFEAEPPPAGRVVVLEDTTGDGQMDERTVFLDDLENPRAVTLVGDGVLVTDPPRVYFCRDMNGDGRADEKTRVLDDFGDVVNPHASPNLLFRAMDNWYYGVAWPARLRWVDGDFERDEPVVARGQWGMAQDDYGRLYYGRNTDPARSDVLPPAYWRGNPNHPGRAGVDVRLDHERTVWPHGITPGVNRRGQLRDDGTLKSFTANAGVAVYRGGQFPEAFHGDLFVPELAANLIRRYRIEEEDGTLTAENAYDQREFLFSHDERFRPVSLYTAPDGSMYVVDMYRGIIEGHLFITTFLRNQILDRDLHQPFQGLGRIYRIVHEDNELASPPPMHEQPSDVLVDHLAHRNGWWRDTAQRLLVERGEVSVVPALEQLAAHGEEARTRVQALWTLEGMDAISATVLQTALQDSSHRVRAAGLRMAGDHIENEAVLEAVLSQVDHERIEVRRLALLALGQARGERAEQALADLLHRDLGQAFVLEAGMSALGGRELAFTRRLAGDEGWQEPNEARARLFRALAAAVVRAGREADMYDLLALAGDSEGPPRWVRRALLAGVDSAAEDGLAVEPEALAPALASADKEIRQRALSIVTRIRRAASAESAGEPTEGLNEQEKERYEVGRQAFAICMACHGPEGQGVEGQAPSLADSKRLGGSEEALVRIVLHGFEERPEYPVMTPIPGLDDETIAAILTYVRRSWGHDADSVDPATVERVREQTADRQAPWTVEELDAF